LQLQNQNSQDLDIHKLLVHWM